MRNLRFMFLGLILVGCVPLVGSLSSGAWFLTVLIAAASLLFAGCASTETNPTKQTQVAIPAAGPQTQPPTQQTQTAPPKCTGSWHNQCVGTQIQQSCCPKGAICNYASYTDCGHSLCVSGKDPSMCPTPQPQLVAPAGTPASDCKGEMEEACVEGKVQQACIMPFRTNYSGPARNPHFKRCWTDQCTTGQFLSACMPTRAELGDKKCEGEWLKACVRGAVSERCFPRTNNMRVYRATRYQDCGKARCAIGVDKKACVR